MKLAIATIFTLALAMGVQSSIIPIGWHSEVAAHGHGLSYTAVSGPAVVHSPIAVAHHVPAVHHVSVAHHVPVHAVHAPAAVAVHAAVHPAVVAAHPGVVVAHGHPAAHVVAHVPAHEGTYVAQTRGAVHTAPLSGHVQSAAAINVAPAPGTV